jgi:hypothetical protein
MRATSSATVGMSCRTIVPCPALHTSFHALRSSVISPPKHTQAHHHHTVRHAGLAHDQAVYIRVFNILDLTHSRTIKRVLCMCVCVCVCVRGARLCGGVYRGQRR